MAKVMLIIRDGWGFSEKQAGNAIFHAKKPFDDYLLRETSQALLVCHGERVGLPPGFQGSSEVGHLNMGAGRIVEQEVTRIFSAITEGRLFSTSEFAQISRQLGSPGARLHLFGLLQDEGVHAHQEHLFQILASIKRDHPAIPVRVHCIADGRDTPPRSFRTFFRRLQEIISQYPDTSVGTVWGRYYGMDRSKHWELIRTAYRAMVFGEGRRTNDVLRSVDEAYRTEVTPDNVPMFDEYLTPLIVAGYDGIRPGDVVINFNYRQDRAIQITKAFVDPACPAWDPASAGIHYYGLTQYYDQFDRYLMPPMSEGDSMRNLLGEVVSGAGLRQLRIAETQKFRHVTSFFNGKRTEPWPLEDQIEIPSQYDPSTFASHPEMNAADVTRELLDRLTKSYEFVAVNYANCDMVGHTGDYEAAREGARIVDENVETATRKARELGYAVLITADHGNSEEMIDENGEPKTSHTINPVKLHLLADRSVKLPAGHGILSDIAPLILRLMGLPVPADMTSRGLADSSPTLIPSPRLHPYPSSFHRME